MPRDSPEVSVQSQPWGVSHNTVPGVRSQPGSWFGAAVTRVPSALPVPLAELTALGVNVPEALRAAATGSDLSCCPRELGELGRRSFLLRASVSSCVNGAMTGPLHRVTVRLCGDSGRGPAQSMALGGAPPVTARVPPTLRGAHPGWRGGARRAAGSGLRPRGRGPWAGSLGWGPAQPWGLPGGSESLTRT